MKSQRRRLYALCEDDLHQRFVERLAERWGIGDKQRIIVASPSARGSASDFVLDNYVDVVKRWRAESHDANVSLLIVIDGDKEGVIRRRQQLAQRLQDARVKPIDSSAPVAIIVPTWHIETWIGWLCGHRPVDERTRYKPDNPAGREVARKIERGEYSPKRAVDAWTPRAHDEERYVPALTDARSEVRRLGV